MFRLALLTAASALALAGCSGGDGGDANAANATIEGSAENGQLSARVQGVDLKINLPPPIRRMTEDNGLVYPGARTVHNVAPGEHFHSDDPPETVARWYQDPARANRFTVSVHRRDPVLVLSGQTRNGETLSVTLAPGAGGGTDGIVLAIGR